MQMLWLKNTSTYEMSKQRVIQKKHKYMTASSNCENQEKRVFQGIELNEWET